MHSLKKMNQRDKENQNPLNLNLPAATEYQ